MSKLKMMGVDVGASELVACWRDPRGNLLREQVPNSSRGIKKLISKARGDELLGVVMEATGVYHFDLALTLDRHDRHQVMVVNPAAARMFAKMMRQRSKTDPSDAEMLLYFGEKQEWQDWAAPSDAALQLRAVSRHLWSLTKRLVAERNRRARSNHSAIDVLLREDIELGIEQLKTRIRELRHKAEALIKADDELSAMLALLLTIPGISSVSAVQLIGELSTLPPDMTAKQLVAHAGLDPRSNESGSSVRGRVRISKQGSGHLRRILFMPAMVARTHSPQVRTWSSRLEQRGKTPKQAVVAVMRKLLHAMWGMLKSGTAWDGDRFDGHNIAEILDSASDSTLTEPGCVDTARSEHDDGSVQGQAPRERGAGRSDRTGAPLRRDGDGVSMAAT